VPDIRFAPLRRERAYWLRIGTLALNGGTRVVDLLDASSANGSARWHDGTPTTHISFDARYAAASLNSTLCCVLTSGGDADFLCTLKLYHRGPPLQRAALHIKVGSKQRNDYVRTGATIGAERNSTWVRAETIGDSAHSFSARFFVPADDGDAATVTVLVDEHHRSADVTVVWGPRNESIGEGEGEGVSFALVFGVKVLTVPGAAIAHRAWLIVVIGGGAFFCLALICMLYTRCERCRALKLDNVEQVSRSVASYPLPSRLH
jgi:hypothetical protein